MGSFVQWLLLTPTFVGISAIKNCGMKTCPTPTLHNGGHALNYCGAKNHYPDNRPHSPFRDSSQRSRPPNRRTSGASICGEFNNGQCTRNACTFQHICFTCKGPHPRISCPDRRPATQKPVRPTSGHGDRSFLSVTKPLIDHCLHSGSQAFNLYSI